MSLQDVDFATTFAFRSLPSLFVVLVVLHDLFSLFTLSAPIRSALCRLQAPFRNFLSLEDLNDLGGKHPTSEIRVRALLGLAFFSSAYWAGYAVYGLYATDEMCMTNALVVAISWVYISCYILLRPPITPPYLFLLYASSQAFLSLVNFGRGFIDSGYKIRYMYMCFTIMDVTVLGCFIWIAGMFPLANSRPAFNVARPGDKPSSFLSCPEDDVNLWSWSTFTFVEPILELASRRTLNDADVWGLSPFFRHRNIFNKYLEYQDSHPHHSLLRFLLVSNSLDLILDVVLEMWSAVVGYVPPFALKEILSTLASNDEGSRSTAFYWALITFFAHLSFAQVDLFQLWHTRRCYERTRGQLFCALHHKSLKRQEVSGRISHEGESDNADLGKIVNLMQGDTYAVAQRFWEFSGIFTSPLRLAIALVFLYQILGWSALSGVVVILLAYALNFPLAKYNISITRASWRAKDKRMNIVNELLQNIRFLKFYGWEYQWSRKAQDSRNEELTWRVKENVVDTLISFIWIWIPSATALTSFLCYTLIAGQHLTVSKAFTSIALFTQLQEPMTALPGQFFAILHAYVSMQRIEEFLREDDVPQWASTLSTTVPDRNPIDDNVGFIEAVFEWQENKDPSSEPSRFQLGPLNIYFPRGMLTLVTGATGSGKTALLAALLGEMYHVSGSVTFSKANHQVAFCGQVPWLEHATIRDNIIFNCVYGFNETRYQAVLEACALIQDLNIFDAGDMTEIGEKGITLSGGQRARIALARAMYSQAKFILLDDPLAAVDMHTAQHLVKNCLVGDLAQDRTIILVTHHVTLCAPIASYVIELQEGKIRQQGACRDIMGNLSAETKFEDELLSEEIEETLSQEQIRQKHTPPTEPDQKVSGKLIEAEARAEGRVSLRTYITYIQAAGIFSWVLTVLLMISIRLVNIGNQLFLAKWGEAYQNDHSSLVPWNSLPPPDVDVRPWLATYLYISMTGAILVLLYIALGYYASLQASRSLFESLLKRLTRAPARFFDVTPLGRILNRFTTDINTIDGALQNSARNCLSGIFNFIASFTVILVVVPTFAPFAIAIAWLYIRLAPPYIKASRDLRRLESISLSPAFAGFDELLRGIVHIRAFGMEQRYQERFYARVDKFQSFDHVYWLVNGWLRWRYDCLGSVVVFAATMFALWQGVSNGSAAIVIVQAGIFAEASRQLVRVAAQLELDFNSVERVVEYFDVPQEAPAVVEKCRPPAYWPSTSGELVVDNLLVRYAPHLQPALRGISFVVKPSEKIGIVGRTGSGKSTLALSFLRMVEPSGGSIILDGIDISSLGLEDLRTHVTIVSQDVSLFSGTIRSNIDPLEQSSPGECLAVLERCHLTSILNSSASSSDEDGRALLDMRITQGSLSAGEKQLVALARAILRRTNVIIMDEATSQIDAELDERIQQTIRDELAGAIVITIAHRLKTIIDYDRVLVLEDGRILEFGPPRELLKTVGGPFREMCRRSTDWPHLQTILQNQ